MVMLRNCRSKEHIIPCPVGKHRQILKIRQCTNPFTDLLFADMIVIVLTIFSPIMCTPTEIRSLHMAKVPNMPLSTAEMPVYAITFDSCNPRITTRGDKAGVIIIVQATVPPPGDVARV